MKSLFNYLKTIVMALAAVVAVACDNTEEPDAGKVEVLEFVDTNLVLEAGATEEVALKEGFTLKNPTVEAPKGWTVVADATFVTITAPSQESVDAETADKYGVVVVSQKEGDTKYEGRIGVSLPNIIDVQLVGTTFCDVQIKAVVSGFDSYRVHIGTNAAWLDSFNEWQTSVDSPTGLVFEFGSEGKYTGVFEGSLFEFATNSYDPDFKPLPGTKYDLAILPMSEDKGALEYAMQDVKVFQFTTTAAGTNGKVVPVMTLDTEKTTHKDVYVKISAPDAYVTCYEVYRSNQYEEINGNLAFIKKELLANGRRSSEAEMVASETGLKSVKSKVYVAAISLDKEGNYSDVVVEEFFSGDVTFNENLKVTLGEITCSANGKTVYIPVSAEGGEVDHYRCAYIINENEWGPQIYGGSLETAEVYIATALNEYYGPGFYYPEGTVIMGDNGQPKQINLLEDGKIVITRGLPGAKARIVVLAMGPDGIASHAEYTEFTPTDNSFVIIEADDEGYEFGMPTVTYKDVVTETKNDIPAIYVNFNIDLGENTQTAWVCIAGEDYIAGRTATALVKEMMDEKAPFMKTVKFTEDGVFKGDSMYAVNSAESKCAVFVTWLDTNGKYHETKLMYEPVAAAQEDLKNAGAI